MSKRYVNEEDECAWRRWM